MLVVPGVEQTGFGELTIGFDSTILRPRPWTTAQSYWAADLLSRSPEGPVLELCAGAGQIGLLAVREQARDLVMVDADKTACRYAERNAATAGVPGAVTVRHGRIDEALDVHERFVAVVADPPWVCSGDTECFPEDPVTAIDGGPDGLRVAWTCLEVAAAHLVDHGWVLLQLGSASQARALVNRARDRRVGLELVEQREFGDRGVLLHLVRRCAQPADLPFRAD